MKKVLYGLIGLAGAAAVMAAPKDAAAVLTLQLSDGSTTVTVGDGGVGDSSAAAGVVTYNGGVGAVFTVNVTTGLSTPVIGSAAVPVIDLNSVDVGGAGTLTIKLTNTGYSTSGTLNAVTNVGGTISSGVGNGLTFSTYADSTNAAFGQEQQIGSILSFTPVAFSGSTSGTITVFNPFSLTQVALITFGAGGGIASFDGFTSVPEPATLALLGTGLVGFGWLVRRRQKSA